MGKSSGQQKEPSLDEEGAPVRANSETAAFKEALKRLLRVQGIPYRKVAEALGVSTVTVKRYFNTDRLTVGRMEEICALLDISLTELADVVKADDPAARAVRAQVDVLDAAIRSEENRIRASLQQTSQAALTLPDRRGRRIPFES